MRIGIDIDDTLVDTSISFESIKKKYNINFYKKWQDEWTKEEMDLIFYDYLEDVLLNSKFKEKAVEVVNYLYELGHEIFIITARSNNYSKVIKEKTMQILKNKGIKISGIYFDQNKKSDLAKKLNIDLMIDDNLCVYNNMKKEGIECILFGDKIKTWDEILKYIKAKEE